MIFKIISTLTNHFTFVGVLEFIAEEGTMILPSWIMENLDLDDGTFVMIAIVDDLPKVLNSFYQNLFREKKSNYSLMKLLSLNFQTLVLF